MVKKNFAVLCVVLLILLLFSACRADDVLVGRWKRLPPERAEEGHAAIASVYTHAEMRIVEVVYVFHKNFTGAILGYTYGGDILEGTFVWRRSGGVLTRIFDTHQSILYYDLTEPYLSLTSQPLVSAFTNRPITPPVTSVLRRVTDETD